MFGKTKFQASARLDEEGNVSVKVIATTPYGKRSATVTHEIGNGEVVAAIENQLNDAISSVRETLEKESLASAAESFALAMKKKEEV